MKNRPNLILMTDSYKFSHYKQYPKGTEYVHSYIESRGGKFDEIVMFGLQAIVKEYLTQPITKEDIDEASEFAKAHGVPFNRQGWEYIRQHHEGYIPLEIRAVSEGTVVKTKNVLAVVENTDPNCAWVTSYFEPLLLRVWYPITVATQSREIKKVIKKFLVETADNAEGLPFKLHDFGARGVSSHESAAIGGAAHIVNFMGSDTVEGIIYAKKYYDAGVAAFSIPAAEHSTMTIKGREGELEQFERMLDQFPTGLVAVVSDSYDLFNAIDNYWGGVLKEKILAREGTLVVRPDSGNPKEIVLETLNRLGDKFGYTLNQKGFKILPDQVRVIQGDGVNLESIQEILETIADEGGWSADNVAFGMGGALLQQVDRDTQKFAMKASAAKINGKWVDVFKDPITDQGKTSKKGRLALANHDGELVTVRRNEETKDQLVVLYRNGRMINTSNFEQVRERAEIGDVTYD